MREIKFRAWQGGRFNYWGFIKSRHGDDYEFHAIADNNAEPLSMTEKMNRSQQYTGLKDKNGKEIYEGDILDFGEWSDRSGRCLHTVIWNEKDACFSTYEPRETTTYGLDPFSEVIGNIYENPIE